jgi:O-antigen ligase
MMRERLAFTQPAIAPAGAAPVQIRRDEPPSGSSGERSALARRASRDNGFTGLLLFTTVLLVRPQDQIPGLAVLHLAEVAALVGLVPMIVGRLSRGLTPVPVTTETVLLVGFGLVILGTAPFSIWPGGAFALFAQLYVKALVIFLLMISTINSPARLERFTWLILVCVGYVAFRGSVNYFRGVNLVEDDRLAGPVGGIFGNPNDLALNMVTFLPFTLVTMMSALKPTGRRLAAAGIAALMVAAIVFSKSRGGALGLVIMLASLYMLGRRINPAAAGAALVGLVILAPLAPSSFWSRMESIVDARQDEKEFTGSREARRMLLQDALQAFVEHPLTGIGAGQFRNYNPPDRQERWRETHNVLLQVAAETGIAGFCLFCALVWCAAVSAAKTRRLLAPAGRVRRVRARTAKARDRGVMYEHAVAAMAGLIGWFSCAMFASVAYTWTFYYLLGLIVSAREISREEWATA